MLSNIDVRSEDNTLWQSQLIARQPAVVGWPQRIPSTPFPEGFDSWQWVLPGFQSGFRSAFDGFCAMKQFTPNIKAETDDMAMLRLLARDTGALTVLPAVVVQDELKRGDLAECLILPNVYENFYAITIKRQYTPAVLRELLKDSGLNEGINEQKDGHGNH